MILYLQILSQIDFINMIEKDVCHLHIPMKNIYIDVLSNMIDDDVIAGQKAKLLMIFFIMTSLKLYGYKCLDYDLFQLRIIP